MPIAFPPARMGSLFDDYPLRYRSPFAVIPYANLARPGVTFSANALDPGGAWPRVATNVRRLGAMYQNVQNTAVVNPVNRPVTDGLVYDRVLSRAQWRITGVSRDSAGATLGVCVVLVYRTDTKLLAAETISDSSGNWSVLVDQPTTYFFVEYKAGSPDVFGTSLNTRTPVQI